MNLVKVLRSKRGVSALEYAILAAVLVAGLATAAKLVKDAVDVKFNSIATTINTP